MNSPETIQDVKLINRYGMHQSFFPPDYISDANSPFNAKSGEPKTMNDFSMKVVSTRSNNQKVLVHQTI